MGSMIDRELLAQLYTFLQARTFITIDKASVIDMVQRYKNPPMTLRNCAAMQMTMKEYNQLGDLLLKIREQLQEAEHA